MGPDTYWEIYTNNTRTYIATVEDEDFGDYLAQHRADEAVRTLSYFLKSLTKLCLTFTLSWTSGLDSQTTTLTTVTLFTTR